MSPTLAFWLVLQALAPALAPPSPAAIEEVAGAVDCRRARQVAEMRPCLDPASCPALEAWSELLVPPGARRLDPVVRLRGPNPRPSWRQPS